MSKFYIYARGRWCEVDVSSGQVEGFRERARFCYLSGGRLHAARSAAVLRAVRTLAAGAPGAARDGPALPTRRHRRRRRSRRSRPPAITHHCCAHVHAGCKGISELPPPVTPVSPILPAPQKDQRKRRISDQSPPPVTTPLKRQKIDEKSDNEDKKTQQTQEKAKVPLSLKDSPIKKAVNALIISSSSEEEKPVERSPRKRILNREPSSDDSPPKRRSPLKPHARVTRQNVSRTAESEKEPIIVDSIRNNEEKAKPVKNQAEKGSKVVTDANKLVQMLLDSSSEASDSSRALVVTQPRERCKELLISESDVNALRLYLQRTRSGRASLSRFDHDERYKLRVFHRLNPLVTLERCQPLENLLRQKVTLKEFARNLGLRSVADVTPEKRYDYKMRRSVRKASATSDSEHDKDKENEVKPKKRKLWNNNNLLNNSVRSSRSTELRPRIPIPNMYRDSSKDTSDSDTEFKRRVREQLKNKPILKRRESFTEARRRTRSTGRLSIDQARPNQEVSSVKPNNPEVRQTRLSGKLQEQNTSISKHALQKPASESERDRMKLKLARISRSVEGSEWEVVNKRANSNSVNPSRTLKEQNNDSGNEFKEKSSPKKGNSIKRGKLEAKSSPVKQKESSESLEKKSTDKRARVVSSMLAKPVKFKKSCVANGREYTSLEDHAIVAWVSCNGRERLVNGNRVWRELASQYQRLTGQSRSWHSLRNRYLRYVLPSLPALALPPAQVTRLRAAAAAGEIKLKSKSSQQRRNSIFAAPPALRSASARRPPPAAGDEDEDEARVSPRRSHAPPSQPRPPSSPARLTRSAEQTNKHTPKSPKKT